MANPIVEKVKKRMVDLLTKVWDEFGSIRAGRANAIFDRILFL